MFTLAIVCPAVPRNRSAREKSIPDGRYLDECASYALVELLEPTGGAVLPGYGRENCDLLGKHASEQGAPLAWAAPNGTRVGPPVGVKVRARIFLRDATVFSLGGGTAWGHQPLAPL